MKKIKLMPDYHCFPLWRIDDDICCNIDPYSLPVSNMLAEELTNWANEYDKTLNMNDPVNSGFEDTEKEQAFIDKGNKYFASILMHAKQKRRVAALLFLC